jgi:hypothetical protein
VPIEGVTMASPKKTLPSKKKAPSNATELSIRSLEAEALREVMRAMTKCFKQFNFISAMMVPVKLMDYYDKAVRDEECAGGDFTAQRLVAGFGIVDRLDKRSSKFVEELDEQDAWLNSKKKKALNR